MLSMTTMHYLGAVIILAIISAIGIYSGKKVKTASDFSSGGRKAGANIVAGTIMGALVGGASTVGTAQLAFSYGLSAWWFTLGSGIGCLILAVFFAKPLHDSGITTLPQVIAMEYGQTASTLTTILTSAGNFLTIAAQVLAGIALITSVSTLSPAFSAVLVILLMLAYIAFGGVWGAGLVGIAKMCFLYFGMGVCGFLVVYLQGGLEVFYQNLPNEQYFNLFARGFGIDFGGCLSVILGVLTTQAYVQAVISASSVKISRKGVLFCSLFIPPIGVAGILVGLYMKLNYPYINPASALPIFIMESLPPLVAGSFLAILLVTIVGSGAVISLGISSMLCNDIYKVYVNKNPNDDKLLFYTRLFIVLIMLATLLVTALNTGAMILDFTYLSMGLRGAVAFGPLCMALFLPGRTSKEYIIASMIIAPILVLLGGFFLPQGIDPLFLGVAGSLTVICIGMMAGAERKSLFSK